LKNASRTEPLGRRNVLEDKGGEIAALTLDFLDRKVARK
jgi:hypothetical protein